MSATVDDDVNRNDYVSQVASCRQNFRVVRATSTAPTSGAPCVYDRRVRAEARRGGDGWSQHRSATRSTLMRPGDALPATINLD